MRCRQGRSWGSGWVLDVWRGKGGKAKGPRTGKDSRKARYFPFGPRRWRCWRPSGRAGGWSLIRASRFWANTVCWLGRIRSSVGASPRTTFGARTAPGWRSRGRYRPRCCKS